MHVDVFDKDDAAAAQSAPALLDPFLGNEAVYENVQMSNAALVKFQDSDVLNGAAKFPAQVEPKLVKDRTQVPNGVAFNYRGVQREREKTPKLFTFCELCDEMFVSFCFSRAAKGATPCLTIHTMKNQPPVFRHANNCPLPAITFSLERFKLL